MELTKENMPDFIKQLRKDSNTTLQEFGNLFGVSTQSVHNWERGLSMPNTFQQTMLIEFRKKINSLLSGSMMAETQYSEPKLDLSRLLLSISLGAGVVVFLKWLFNDDV